MTARTRNRIFFCLLSSAFCLLPSCGEEKGRIAGVGFHNDIKTRDPQILLSLIASTTTPDDSRLQADKIYKDTADPKSDARLAVLEQMLFAPGHSETMRIYAIDQLAAADPNRCARAFINYLPRLEENASRDVLEHACNVAVKLQDLRLLAPLARSASNAYERNNLWHDPYELARVRDESQRARLSDLRVTQLDRPEISAILQLSNKYLAETMFDLAASSREQSVRIAAINIAFPLPGSRFPPPHLTTKEYLAQLPSDAWSNQLRRYYEVFAQFPAGQTEYSWLPYLTANENLPAIKNARAHALPLIRQETENLDTGARYTHAWLFTQNPQTFKELRAAVQTKLAQVQTTRREQLHATDIPNDPGLPADNKWLYLEDLLTINLLLTALQNPATINEFHRLGLEDMSDATSEHGGLLSLKNREKPEAVITPYKPQFTDNDQRYAVSDDLLRDAIKGLVLYHFHFHKIHNAALAGPGAGDLAFARKTRTNHIVITSVGPRRLNIDYYTPNGLVIDLGTYTAKD